MSASANGINGAALDRLLSNNTVQGDDILSPDVIRSGGQLGRDCAIDRPALRLSGTGIEYLRLLHELRLQLHGTDAVDLAVDVMVAVDQTNVPDLGPHLDDQRRTLHLEILDHRDRVAICQRIAVGVTDHTLLVVTRRHGLGRPFMTAFRAEAQLAVLVGVGRLALRAGR